MQLTKRQIEVADRLVEGMTISAMADDLALTESRVNQIIRALKDRFKTDTQAGIVAAYQRALSAREVECAETEDQGESTGVGSESLVPELLNAPHPILYRLLAISIAALILSITFLALTEFSISLSDVSRNSVSVRASR